MLGYKGVREYEEKHDLNHPPPIFVGTYTGKEFGLEEPSPDNVCIEDIAHALSHICRFNGHIPLFYSVAQHCLLVSDKMPGTAKERLAGLMHDAAETYVCDIPSPVKPFLGEPYRVLFAKVQQAIMDRFQIESMSSMVSLYDRAAVVFEAQAFYGYDLEALVLKGYNPRVVGLWTPWNPKKFGVDETFEEPWDIEAKFIKRFSELMDRCGKGDLV